MPPGRPAAYRPVAPELSATSGRGVPAVRLVGFDGPRTPNFMGPQQAASVQPETLERFRAATKPFAEWLLEEGLEPLGVEEFDDVTVEWHALHGVARSYLDAVIAAV